jgi:5-deoxy-glucuronate isomerase
MGCFCGVFTMSLLVRMPERACGTTRIREVASPASPELELRYIYLGFVRIRQGERRGFDFGPMDTVAVVLSGAVEAAWEGADGQMRRETLEGRRDVFDGLPWAICARPYTTLFLKGLSGPAELALIRAELIAEGAAGSSDELPRPGAEIKTPERLQAQAIGRGKRSGEVRYVAAVTRSGHGMIIGETLMCAAEAEDESGGERDYEEVRHFRLRPETGLGTQRVRSRDSDCAFRIRNQDTVAIPSGFRPDPATAAPGHDLYCLWALAGPSQSCPPSCWLSEVRCDSPRSAAGACEPGHRCR